ncbi:regulatory protein, luxR family [Sinosporangium album]|uniref:Regulatory protein, luxR family n=1 Tax=Sinosporangium album TaxID=504805 RepID=A0A1G8FBA6_9ACTN|nr:LuxR C-terminal-related transcriptional regulator [Sinosporangium album]SDH79426.1 regulatory protein, luxR family [Sinosporangium album]
MAYPDLDSHRHAGSLEAHGLGLTEDDLVILAELAKGVTVDRVGRRLDISGRTVRRRLRGICDRIGVATAIEAVAWAARRRLI